MQFLIFKVGWVGVFICTLSHLYNTSRTEILERKVQIYLFYLFKSTHMSINTPRYRVSDPHRNTDMQRSAPSTVKYFHLIPRIAQPAI